MSENQQQNVPRFRCGVGVWMGPYPAEDAQNELLAKVNSRYFLLMK
jgi:hypothetical protein